MKFILVIPLKNNLSRGFFHQIQNCSKILDKEALVNRLLAGLFNLGG